ncbi:MAG: thioesterase family protein [Clostridia bacterium]|nr:thioesterase family protein [Clostridia bacterium]
MQSYVHRVNYYETDKMGITHHSNYIRFMEEARMALLRDAGFPMTRLEQLGITSPVVSVSCEYRHTTTFDDDIQVEVSVTGYTGVRLSLHYDMRNLADGTLAASADSVHCFISHDGRPVQVRKFCP